ncbi:hypothetical protein BC628DRAFT_1416300 [Trametes gibbosa]|nr:hypothetical protein BC628DRAFT_1416300 [Trametes gibbosa]
MSFTGHSCDTFVPMKRSVPTDSEPSRISRSMTAEDPYSRNLLVHSHSPPPVPASTRRRVNPESLAVRLGPELVKELESYVQNGVVEMPSFAVRQHIQKRHKVDRRHIYDWFHSKGLRVTKEDKRATVEQKTDAMRMQRRIRRCIAPAVPSASVCPPLSDAATDSAPSSPALLTPPVLPSEFLPSVAPKPVFASSVDYHRTVRHKRDSPNTVNPAALTSSVCTSEFSSASRVLKKMNTALNLPAPPAAGYTRKFRDAAIETVFLIDDTTVLDSTKRENCYDTLSRVLGPAEGVQECVGTYKAHMARQLEIYYEEFLPTGSFCSGSLCGHPGHTGSMPLCSQTTDPGLSLQDTPHAAVSDGSTRLWDALGAVFGWAEVSQNSSHPHVAENWMTVSNTPSYDGLTLDDILTTPVLESERPRAVTFAPHPEVPSHCPLAQDPSTALSFFSSSSSSLAGALGDMPSSFAQPDLDARRKSKEWARPRMGRARAYSAGGGM